MEDLVNGSLAVLSTEGRLREEATNTMLISSCSYN